MNDISSLSREKQEEAVWLTAYFRALHESAPAEAEVVAIDALCRFRSRWIGVSTPEGVDPRVYAACRQNSERTRAEFETSLANPAETKRD